MKYLNARLAKLPRTEYTSDLANEVAPRITFGYNGDGTIPVLSTENGNLHSFEYVNHDYPIDLKQELKDWAKQYGWEWQCQYTGTYILTEAV
jgi:hypothetical protein